MGMKNLKVVNKVMKLRKKLSGMIEGEMKRKIIDMVNNELKVFLGKNKRIGIGRM